MQKQSIMLVTLGFLVGVLITLILTRMHYQKVVANMSTQPAEKRGEEMGLKAKMMVEMDAMSSELEHKSGGDLDKTFLRVMVPHHIGAIAMAKEILERGDHPELKEMAQKIVDTQTDEVTQMEKWQKEWGYEKP